MDESKRKVREFILSNLSFKIYRIPEYDAYEVRAYWKGAPIKTVEQVDGLELACWCYGDGSDGENEMNRERGDLEDIRIKNSKVLEELGEKYGD